MRLQGHRDRPVTYPVAVHLSVQRVCIKQMRHGFLFEYSKKYETKRTNGPGNNHGGYRDTVDPPFVDTQFSQVLGWASRAS
jgi:hypothetical protein